MKPKNETLEEYLKLTDSIVKLLLLYASNCWEDSFLKKIFLSGKFKSFTHPCTSKY